MRDGFIEIDRLSIPSDFTSISNVEFLIDNICSKLKVNEDYYGNVLIAVTEAVNNAIQHGNKMKPEVSVELWVGEENENFCFTIKDSGDGFDFNSLPDPTSPENIEKEDGRGIYLMKSLADDVVFENGGREVSVYFSKG